MDRLRVAKAAENRNYAAQRFTVGVLQADEAWGRGLRGFVEKDYFLAAVLLRIVAIFDLNKVFERLAFLHRSFK